MLNRTRVNKERCVLAHSFRVPSLQWHQKFEQGVTGVIGVNPNPKNTQQSLTRTKQKQKQNIKKPGIGTWLEIETGTAY